MIVTPSLSQKIENVREFGNWTAVTMRDTITDESWPTTTANDYLRRQVLRIDCRKSILIIVLGTEFNHGIEYGLEGPITIRADRNAPQQVQWVGYGDKRIYPTFGTERTFLRVLVNSKEISIRSPRVPAFMGEHQDVIILTNCAKEALSDFTGACGPN